MNDAGRSISAIAEWPEFSEEVTRLNKRFVRAKHDDTLIARTEVEAARSSVFGILKVVTLENR